MRMGHEQIAMWKGGTTKSTAWQERAIQTYTKLWNYLRQQAATEVSLLQLEAGGVVAPSRCSGKKRKTKDNSREVFERVLFR